MPSATRERRFETVRRRRIRCTRARLCISRDSGIVEARLLRLRGRARPRPRGFRRLEHPSRLATQADRPKKTRTLSIHSVTFRTAARRTRLVLSKPRTSVSDSERHGVETAGVGPYRIGDGDHARNAGPISSRESGNRRPFRRLTKFVGCSTSESSRFLPPQGVRRPHDF